MLKLVWLLTAGLWLMSFDALSEVRLKFCYENKELLPYYTGSGKTVPTQDPGEAIMILRQLDSVFNEVRIRYERRPWKRCLGMLVKGNVDAVVASYYSARKSIGRYPMKNGQLDVRRPFSRSGYCLYKRPESQLDWNGEYFSGSAHALMAVPQGYSVIDRLKSEEVAFIEVVSSGKAFELLTRGRVEGVVTLCATGKGLVHDREGPYHNIIEDQPPIIRKQAYLLFSHRFYQRNPALAEQLWDALGERVRKLD